MRMMEPLVTLWPWRGFIGFWKHCLDCWCCGGHRESWWYVCGRSVDISDAGFLMLKRACAFLSVSVVPARPIKFYSFIFHSSAVSSSYSAIAPWDSVQLTAPWEPKLRVDHLLFWSTSPGQSCFNANTLRGVSVGLAQVVGEKCRPNLSLAQTRIHFYSAQ